MFPPNRLGGFVKEPDSQKTVLALKLILFVDLQCFKALDLRFRFYSTVILIYIWNMEHYIWINFFGTHLRSQFVLPKLFIFIRNSL